MVPVTGAALVMDKRKTNVTERLGAPVVPPAHKLQLVNNNLKKKDEDTKVKCQVQNVCLLCSLYISSTSVLILLS